jgi:hypothetical protein
MMVKNKIAIIALFTVFTLFICGIASANILSLKKEITINCSDNNSSGPFSYEKKISYDFGDFIQQGIASDDNGHFFISTSISLISGKISVARLENNKFIKDSINGISEIDIGWHIGDPFCDDKYLFVPWISWNVITDPGEVKCHVYGLTDLSELPNSPYNLKMNENYLPGGSSGAYYDGYYYFSSYFPTNFDSRIYKFSFDEKIGFTYEYWSQSLGKTEVQGIEFFNDKCYFIRDHGSDPNVYWIDAHTWDKDNLGRQDLKKYSGNTKGPYEGITFCKNQQKIKAYFGFGNYCFESFENTDCFSDSNLECIGSLEYEKVSPGSVVSGEFKIINKGNDNSLLDWEVIDAPEWTVFDITPSSSQDVGQKPLEYNEEINVAVDIIVPRGQNNDYSGQIKIANMQNPADYCMIDVHITTRRIRTYENNIFLKIFNRFFIN